MIELQFLPSYDVMNDVIYYATSLINTYKVKESRYRPGVAQRVRGGLGCQIFMTFGT